MPLQRKFDRSAAGNTRQQAIREKVMGFEPWLVTIAVLLIGAAAHARAA
jgi:hypothetical protein